MRETLKSAMSLSWATSLFTATQVARMLASAWPEANLAFENVARATASQLGAAGGGARQSPIARDGDERQHGNGRTSHHRRLDTRCVVVIGEGLAAGTGDFALSEESQQHSFVCQAARQMGVPFLVPWLQPPGIYGAPGFPPQPVVLPHLLQTTVVGEF